MSRFLIHTSRDAIYKVAVRSIFLVSIFLGVGISFAAPDKHEEDLIKAYQQLTALNKLTRAADQRGDRLEELALGTKCLHIAETAFGPDNQYTMMYLSGVAKLSYSTHDYQQSVIYCERFIKVYEKMPTSEPKELVLCLAQLALSYQAVGNFDQSESTYRKIIEVSRKHFGENSQLFALSNLHFAEFFVKTGRYESAETQYQKALAIFEAISGRDHLDTLGCLIGLANVYDNMVCYSKSEPLYRRALGIAEKNPDAVQAMEFTLSGLGGLYLHMGDYAKAEPLLEKALKLAEQAFGSEHVDVAHALNNLATLYTTIGTYEKVEPLLKRALKISEKLLGHDDPETLTCRQNLAGLYLQTQQNTKAESLSLEVLAASEKILGPTNPATARALERLAILNQLRLELTNAETLHHRALVIFEMTYGPDHPETQRVSFNLSSTLVMMGRTNEALAMEDKFSQAHIQELSEVLSFASEKQRLAYQTSVKPYTMAIAMEAGPQLALAILRNKCVVLDSILEDRRMAETATNSQDRAILERIATVKQQLGQSAFNTSQASSQKPAEARVSERRKLADEVDQLEGQLARKTSSLGAARRALGVTVEQVQKAIPTNAVLVEYIRYANFVGITKEEDRYGAVVIGASGQPRWVCLGSAPKIEENIRLYQKSVRPPLVKKNEVALDHTLRALYQQVWAPIEPLLPPGTKAIILSPDGDFNFVSFATILAPEDKFLAEKYSIRYVTSGRDLLRSVKLAESGEMAIFAGPTYSSTGLATPENSPVFLEPLPFLATNAVALEHKAKEWNWPVHVYRETNATEVQFNRLAFCIFPHMVSFCRQSLGLWSVHQMPVLSRNEPMPSVSCWLTQCGEAVWRLPEPRIP